LARLFLKGLAKNFKGILKAIGRAHEGVGATIVRGDRGRVFSIAYRILRRRGCRSAGSSSSAASASLRSTSAGSGRIGVSRRTGIRGHAAHVASAASRFCGGITRSRSSSVFFAQIVLFSFLWVT